MTYKGLSFFEVAWGVQPFQNPVYNRAKAFKFRMKFL
jgi:hypothetical protein